jgi:hypothetical protein
LKGIHACKQVFPEISLAHIKIYNVRYTDSIQQGDSDGFDFKDLAEAKKEFGDGLTWQQVDQLTNTGQHNFDFRNYTQTHQVR